MNTGHAEDDQYSLHAGIVQEIKNVVNIITAQECSSCAELDRRRFFFLSAASSSSKQECLSSFLTVLILLTYFRNTNWFGYKKT